MIIRVYATVQSTTHHTDLTIPSSEWDLLTEQQQEDLCEKLYLTYIGNICDQGYYLIDGPEEKKLLDNLETID